MIIRAIIGAIGAVTKYFKEKSASHTRKTFNRLTTKDSSTWNITHNTGSTAVWNWKPERWGSRLVRQKYQGEKGCDDDDDNDDDDNSKRNSLTQIVRTHQKTQSQNCNRQLEASRDNYRQEKDKG
jgi:hypothetical protein